MKTDLNLSVLDSGKYRLMFFRSTDGGNSWVEQDPNIPPIGNHASTYNSLSEIDRVRQIDARHTAAVGELDHGGTYFRFISITSDGGATWKNEFDSTSKVELLPLFDIDFSDTLTGIATGPDQATSIPVVHLFTTHNGGSSWNEASIIPSYIDSTPASRFRIHSYGGEEFAAYLTYYSGAGVDSVYTTRWTTGKQSIQQTPYFFRSYLIQHGRYNRDRSGLHRIPWRGHYRGIGGDVH